MDTTLDKRLGDLVVARRLATWPELIKLREEAVAAGEVRLGSHLAAALVRSGKVPAAIVDQLLLQAVEAASKVPAAAAPTATSVGTPPSRTGVPRPAAPAGRSGVPAPAGVPPGGGPAAAADTFGAVGRAPAADGAPSRSGEHRPPPGAADTFGAVARDAGAARGDLAAAGRTMADPGVRGGFGAAPVAGAAPLADAGRTMADPGLGSAPGGFGSAPGGFGSAPGGFGSAPGGFGSAPGGFGSAPGGFGSAPGGFGSAPGGARPGGFGGVPGAGPASTVAGATRADPGAPAPAAGPSAAARLATIFDGPRFERREELEGGRWRALDRRVRREIVLRIGPQAQGAAPAQSPFFREARLLAAVEHPAIPRVLDAGLDGGRTFVALGLLEGEPLDQVLRGRDRPALPALLRAYLEVTAGLARAHEAGVVHGSLGPDRVVLGDLGRVAIDGWARAGALEDAPPPVREAAALPAPEGEEARRRLAPEREAGRLDARTDVFGLGLVLEAMLLASGGGPGPLRAVARKALQAAPSRRYGSVRALQEDVRRFLDGRSVSAEQEGLVGAAVRLGRRYPAVAAVALALGLSVLGLGGWAASSVRASGLAAAAADQAAADDRAQAADAEAARRRHEEGSGRVRDAVRELVAVEQQLAAARSRYGAGEADARVDEAFEAAEAAARRAAAGVSAAVREAEARKDARAARALREDVLPEPPRALASARLARATFWRRQARPMEPERALRLARELARDVGLDPALRSAALLETFLAARRLAAGAADADDALQQLAAGGGPLAPVVALLQEARRLERAGPVRLPEPEVLAVKQRVEAVLAAHPGSPLALEAAGRVYAATRQDDEGAMRLLYQATLLDPTDPEPSTALHHVLTLVSGFDSPWRWRTGHLLEGLLRNVRATATASVVDPRPVLEAVAVLNRCGRRGGALAALLQPLVDGLRRQARTADGLRPALARVEVMLARARLESGLDAGVDLERLEVPAELAEQPRGLLVRQLVRDGRADEALAVFRQIRRMDEATLADVLEGLLDPGAPPRAVAALIDGTLGPGQQGPVELHVARARARLLLGQDPSADLERFGGQPGSPLTVEMATVTQARAASARQPDHPEAYLQALLVWARVNQVGAPTEKAAVEARAVLVDGLRRAGRADLAAAFERLEVEELWVDRAWLPPEVNRWRSR